ncbi:MAG: response regulator transcription factor, partial [Candidatus Micrarchaeota archaeon]|nr:response regulator transcription factor [Candidatus Micrarchaeota archaeon]
NPIARLLNISDQKAYTATSRWDSEVAGKKQAKREEAGRPSVFAPIPEATNLEIDRLIREGKMSDRQIAEETGVSVASVQNRRSKKNEKETVKIMERVKEAEKKVEEVGPSDVFGIAMFPKEKTDSAKQALRA